MNNSRTSAQHVVVIGGAGFLGSRAVAALKDAPGIRVSVAGRAGRDLVVDLQQPATFAALGDADVVVDCSSSHLTDPGPLAQYCLDNGLVFLEASSDRVVMERLLTLPSTSSSSPPGSPSGSVVLGAGIFTGLSNTLGAAAQRALPSSSSSSSLEIGVRSSPFSGAGQGTVDLIVDALKEPARVIKDGAATTVPAALSGPVLPFPRGARRTLTFSFPEVSMLSRSTNAKAISMSFAPAPSPLWATFRILPDWLLRAAFFRWFMGVYFVVLRRGLLRNVSSRVEVVARATDDAGNTAIASVVAGDGFEVGGVAIAAAAVLLAQRRPKAGLQMIDQAMTATELVAGIRALRPAIDLETAGFPS